MMLRRRLSKLTSVLSDINCVIGGLSFLAVFTGSLAAIIGVGGYSLEKLGVLKEEDTWEQVWAFAIVSSTVGLARRNARSAGQVVKAMILNGLAFVSSPLYMFSEFFNESDYEIVKELLTDFELIVDSYEQPIERPGEYKEKQKYYSGKKKKHTRKNKLIVLPDGKDIIDVVAGRPEPKSDVKLFRESRKGFKPNQKLNGDKAYEGEELTKTPHKKPK